MHNPVAIKLESHPDQLCALSCEPQILRRLGRQCRVCCVVVGTQGHSGSKRGIIGGWKPPESSGLIGTKVY